MKRFRFLLALTAMMMCVCVCDAQTPKEIVQKMSEQLDRCNSEGFAMDLKMKIPLLGEFVSHNMISKSQKMRTEIPDEHKTVIYWSDDQTEWKYSSETNEVVITKKGSSSQSDSVANEMSGLSQIADGYDFTLEKETDEAWYITCKKSKSNKNKDDIKKMDLAVAKATYLPIYTRTKRMGVTVSLENFAIGITDEQVTFKAEEYPDAKIVDNR